MFDQNQIQNKNDVAEILSAVSQRFGKVLENEMAERLQAEGKTSARNAIDGLIRQMENLSRLKVCYDSGGTQEEQVHRRGQSAIMVRDLLTQLDEFAKGRQACAGSSQLSPDLIKAIYYGHLIFTSAEAERRDLMKYLPVSQPAPVKADIPRDENGFELVDISSRGGK